MKVFITGATGLLGRSIYQTFLNSTHFETIGQGFSRAVDPLLKLDLCDQQSVFDSVRSIHPDLIIHSAAVRTPDTCENDHEFTDALNVTATETLAREAESLGAQFIYISTDYVFPGTNPPYSVEAETQPLNYYGKSKLAGENVAMTHHKDCSIFRVPVLYGSVQEIGESAVTEIAKSLLTNDQPKKLDNWATRFPTHVEDVSQALMKFVNHCRDSGGWHPGLFHFSGREPLTKYEMAQIMAQKLSVPADHLVSVDEAPPGPLRPQNTQLDVSRLEKIIETSHQPFAEAIGPILQPFFH